MFSVFETGLKIFIFRTTKFACSQVHSVNTHAGQHQAEEPSITTGRNETGYKEARMFEKKNPEREAVLKHLLFGAERTQS